MKVGVQRCIIGHLKHQFQRLCIGIAEFKLHCTQYSLVFISRSKQVECIQVSIARVGFYLFSSKLNFNMLQDPQGMQHSCACHVDTQAR